MRKGVTGSQHRPTSSHNIHNNIRTAVQGREGHEEPENEVEVEFDGATHGNP